jgi:hypothetical protein
MLSGPPSSACFIVNSSGTLSAGPFVTQEAFSESRSYYFRFIPLNRSNRPSPNAAVFITVIVRVPLVPIFAMLLAMTILAIELPLPAVKKFSLYRSLVVRIVLLVFQVFLTILFYQVRPFILSLFLPSELFPRVPMRLYGL